MAIYTVELFGLSHLFPGEYDLEVELGPEATLGELVGALRRKMPALEGKILRSGEDRLNGSYAFNVNGRFFLDQYDTQIRAADHILILTLALGG
jgi:molybdopterin converting factor small subunit